MPQHYLQLPPLALYIHIPWCIKKCPYCDFNSHENQKIPEADYLELLQQDLLQDLHWVQGRKLQSIFFGGGTPSLLTPETIKILIDYAEQSIGFESNIEITLEANPGTFEQEKFTEFQRVGINRLSIGIQSFQPRYLNGLGRVHDRDEALSAVSMAKQAGFDNINLDLMYGLSGQTLQEALADIQTAIDLEPQHISWYQLTIEPNTVFYRQPPPLPADDLVAHIQHRGTQLLAANGFKQYEVSAFCQEDKQSQHNLNYWSFGDYLGIGAGAHGKCTDVARQKILRRHKTRLPEHYLKQCPPKFKETQVAIRELPVEFMMNALRLKEGVPQSYFTGRTGLSMCYIADSITQLQKQGLIEKNDKKLKTTELGQQFLNSALAAFMND